ncbi:MAG: malto-oligosyltrehalose trehalohydrolase [Chlamydiia bacterium]|nr:malto-oligosyltrehalose trehalohydrolase [Chlamydiia bacterium]
MTTNAAHQKVGTFSKWELDFGASVQKNGTTRFKVWAPYHSSLTLKVIKSFTSFSIPMDQERKGVFCCQSDRALEGDRYVYKFTNGLERPDPVSRYLPMGVHGPTEIMDSNGFEWSDEGWKGINLHQMIFYELHVGAFSRAGNFEGVIDKLNYLKQLGINCIELMPLAEFPGRWNWGYDGVSPFAVTKNYGGPIGLKRLVNAAHEQGIAVCLDVVYNHLGPEGNYLGEFGPYFSQTYRTPWGQPFNYDGAFSDDVRHYVIQNALYWVEEYHLDLLRLDAIHGMFDFSATTLLMELKKAFNEASKRLNRKIFLTAESNLNDARIVKIEELGGLGLDAIWNDDFHHATHVTLTHEKTGSYQDYLWLSDLAKALKDRFVYDWRYSPFRKKHYGNSAKGIPYRAFIGFVQNHDQIGNRPLGERLAVMMPFSRLKLAAALTATTPFLPLLFMGQEYGEKRPFEYFVDYENEKLMRSVFEGRKREFKQEMPFPGKDAFFRSHLSWNLDKHEHLALLNLYKSLFAWRKNHLPVAEASDDEVNVYHNVEEQWIGWEYLTCDRKWVAVFIHFDKRTIQMPLPFENCPCKKIWNTDELIYGGKNSVVFESKKKNIEIPEQTGVFFE